MRPLLFLAVREQARKHDLSMPHYILATLAEGHLEGDAHIFALPTNEIRRKVRG